MEDIDISNKNNLHNPLVYKEIELVWDFFVCLRRITR